MKIYKKTIIILIAILSVIFLSISFSRPAQAARWHRSVPTAIRGNYHNAKLKITVQIQKKNVYYMPDNGAAVSPAKRIYSRKLRKTFININGIVSRVPLLLLNLDIRMVESI